MGRRWGVVVLLAVALGLAGSAEAGFGIYYPTGPDPAVREWPSWPDPVSCGGLSFDPVTAFAGETGAENGSGGPELALRKFIDRKFVAVPTRFWRLAVASETRVEFAQGRLEQGPFWLAFQLMGGEWRALGQGGYCAPRTVRAGLVAASWRLAEGQRLGPHTRRIRVDLGAGGCNGGQSLNEVAGKPEFHQVGHRLVMTIWLEPLPPGARACQALIEPPLVVRLPGRLGHRRLFDGRTYPPRLRQ